MSEVKERCQEIAASLWHAPCTFDELKMRDLLKNISEYSAWTLVNIARDKGYIYEKGEILYCYKKTVKDVLNPAGYEIDISKPYESEIRKAFRKSIGS